MKIAILVSTGFTELDLTHLQKHLIQNKISFDLISSQSGLVQAWHQKTWGNYYPITVSLNDALATDYDVLFVPGGRHISKLMDHGHIARFIKYYSLNQKKAIYLGDAIELLTLSKDAARHVISTPESLKTALSEKSFDLSDDDICESGHLLTIKSPQQHNDLGQKLVAFISKKIEQSSDNSSTFQKAA